MVALQNSLCTDVVWKFASESKISLFAGGENEAWPAIAPDMLLENITNDSRPRDPVANINCLQV